MKVPWNRRAGYWLMKLGLSISAKRAVKTSVRTFAPGQSPDDQLALAKEVLQSIWLYADWRYVTSQLTTAQRDFWADVIDENHIQQDIEEGTLGTKHSYGPVERWWADDFLDPRLVEAEDALTAARAETDDLRRRQMAVQVMRDLRRNIVQNPRSQERRKQLERQIGREFFDIEIPEEA